MDDAEAAAITFPVTSYDNDGTNALAGIRIKVNPDYAEQTTGDTVVMRHELTHFLTLRRLAGSPT